MSLVDDLHFRVPDPHGLKLVAFTCGMLCLSRYTMSVNNSEYNELSTLLEKHVRVQRYQKNSGYSSTLLTIYMPIVWLFMHKGGELPAYPFERRDGTYTVSESVFTPRGEYKRRLFYDISNLEFLVQEGSLALDEEWLVKYNFVGAERMIDVNMTSIVEEIKLEDIPKMEVDNLAYALENVGNFQARISSRISEENLRRQGISLPRSIVYGYGLHSKIEQAVVSKEATDIQIKRISSRTFLVLKQALRKPSRVIVHSRDALNLYYIEELEQKAALLPFAKYLTRTRIAYNMQPYSDAWTLFCMLGPVDRLANVLRLEIASIRGFYHKFGYDDPLFKEGYRIYSSNATLLPEFFKAVNASGKQQIALMNAFEYFDLFGSTRYKYVISPRQLFFVSDNPLSVERILEYDRTTAVSRQRKALYAIFGYTHLLRSIPDYTGGRLKLHLSPSLLNYLNDIQMRTFRRQYSKVVKELTTKF
jgi:hypothetical protein